MGIIGKSFYLQDNVVEIARQLIGKKLYTSFGNQVSGGIICETEAYEGITDRASHAYGNRLTERTKVMYLEGGVAYVYLCYGIHSLFNIVTNKKGVPHAVLIRSIILTSGLHIIKKRYVKKNNVRNILNGPGKVSKALGLHYKHSGMSLFQHSIPGDRIWLENDEINISEKNIKATKRIGIDYAGEDANLFYRFVLTDFFE